MNLADLFIFFVHQADGADVEVAATCKACLHGCQCRRRIVVIAIEQCNDIARRLLNALVPGGWDARFTRTPFLMNYLRHYSSRP